MAAINELLADLADVFSRQEIDEAQMRIYIRELSDLPVDTLRLAVRDLIRSSEFFPTIRAIREAVSERVLALPSESQALAQIDSRLAWGRAETAGEASDDPPVVHVLVKEALDLVGGFYAFKVNDNPSIIRAQFSKLYREMRSRKVKDWQIDTGAIEAA